MKKDWTNLFFNWFLLWLWFRLSLLGFFIFTTFFVFWFCFFLWLFSLSLRLSFRLLFRRAGGLWLRLCLGLSFSLRLSFRLSLRGGLWLWLCFSLGRVPRCFFLLGAVWSGWLLFFLLLGLQVQLGLQCQTFSLRGDLQQRLQNFKMSSYTLVAWRLIKLKGPALARAISLKILSCGFLEPNSCAVITWLEYAFCLFSIIAS